MKRLETLTQYRELKGLEIWFWENLERATICKSNLICKRKKEIFRKNGDDETIIICPADKGKAIVLEDKETYFQKMFNKTMKEADMKAQK